MLQIRRAIITLLLAFSAMSLKAQNAQFALGVRTGYYAAFGGFAAVSLETDAVISKEFEIGGGVQYNTIGKSTVEVRPAYYHNFAWGKLSAEILFNYANLSSINNFAVGAGVGLSSKWIDGKLGYYYRLYGGKSGHIYEPFNVYYELQANLLSKIESWDLHLIITNNEIFELERHYQPSFLVQCRYNHGKHLGVNFGVGCKPSGLFNITVGHYQSFVKLGVCYRW